MQTADAAPDRTAQDEEFQRARALVLRFGTNATSYQILNPGISYWFSFRRDAVVGYVRYWRFRIVAGAPVCAEDRLAAVGEEFERDARLQGQRVCYFGAEAPLASRLGASAGRCLLRIGAQPAWTPANWHHCVEGHASLRAQLNRARNKGVTVRELSSAQRSASRQMERCLEEWLAGRGAPPMHFLVEPRTLGRLQDRRVFVAERQGRIVAFLVASPVPRRRGWLIEQIIRGAAAVNGTSELLVDTAIRAIADSGGQYVTLGLAPLSNKGQPDAFATPVWLRPVLRWLRAYGRRFFNFDGLEAFKAKLRPEEWEPVYAINDRARFSPVVLHAVAGAFTAGSPVLATARAVARALRREMRRPRRA